MGGGVFIPSQWLRVMTQKGRYLIGEERSKVVWDEVHVI